MKTESINVYQFSELSKKTQKLVLARNRYCTIQGYNWFNDIIHHLKKIGSFMGIEIDEIHFRGLTGGPTGGCFDGEYSFKKGSMKALKTAYPLWPAFRVLAEQSYVFAERLQALQKSNGYALTAVIEYDKTSPHPFNSSIEVFKNDETTRDEHGEPTGDIATIELVAIMREFMQLIFPAIHKEFKRLTGDEAIKEWLDDREFFKDGTIYK